jgi:hypothetical protein
VLPGARTRYTFEQIVHLLSTPALVVEFMRNNLRHGGADWDQVHYGTNAYIPAAEVYANGADDCDGLAEFAACVLSKHGFEAYNVGISVDSLRGHNVAGYIRPSDGKIYAIDGGDHLGPFNDWAALAQYFIDKGAADPNRVLWLFYPCINQRAIGPVDVLPHKVIR